jgi:hypothetical protein
LNSVTKFEAHPLPRIDETTSTLYGSRYFTVLDWYSGFWQVGIKEEHKELTVFTVPSGHYEFNRVPFGLANSPARFQRLMDTVLKTVVGTECYIFLHDVMVYSKSAEDHAARLMNLLLRFDETKLLLNPEKCVFAHPQIQYLGFVLSERGISTSPENVKTIRQYKAAKKVRDVRAFLGLACFYRRLVQNFSDLAKPLTTRTRTGREFSWGPSQKEASTV